MYNFIRLGWGEVGTITELLAKLSHAILIFLNEGLPHTLEISDATIAKETKFRQFF